MSGGNPHPLLFFSDLFCCLPLRLVSHYSRLDLKLIRVSEPLEAPPSPFSPANSILNVDSGVCVSTADTAANAHNSSCCWLGDNG